MDQSQQYVQDLEKLFHASKDVLLTTKANPKLDGICALLAFAKAFESMPLATITGPGQQRKVVRAVAGRQGSQFNGLTGSDLIVSELGLRDFVIGLPNYVDKSVDSVSWYVDQGRLHVVLKSNPAAPMQFDPKTFDPFYAGANFDVVCVVDADTPADLGSLYRQDPGMFTELPVVNISASAANTRYGRVNVVDTNVSCVSELIYEMLSALHVHMDGDTAALLLAGIEDGTEFLSQRMSARTQEIVDQLRNIAPMPLEVRGLRTQALGQPLPVHPQGLLGHPQGMPAPFPGAGAIPYGMPPGVMPQGVPYPYGVQPGQIPPGYGVMPQGYPGQLPMPPGYGYAAVPPGYSVTQNQPQITQSGVASTNPQAPSAFSQFHAPVGGQYGAQGQQPNQMQGGSQVQGYGGQQWGGQQNQPQQPSIPQGYNDYGKGGEGGGRV